MIFFLISCAGHIHEELGRPFAVFEYSIKYYFENNSWPNSSITLINYIESQDSSISININEIDTFYVKSNGSLAIGFYVDNEEITLEIGIPDSTKQTSLIHIEDENNSDLFELLQFDQNNIYSTIKGDSLLFENLPELKIMPYVK